MQKRGEACAKGSSIHAIPRKIIKHVDQDQSKYKQQGGRYEHTTGELKPGLLGGVMRSEAVEVDAAMSPVSGSSANMSMGGGASRKSLGLGGGEDDEAASCASPAV